MDVAQLGIQVNSGPAVKAAADLDRLTASAAKADIAADKLATNSGRIAPAMAGAGQGSRMFAMQLSQVAQQASATGNFVQALAIQLPDMAMGFGAAGIAAGVFASVALPAVVSMMMSSTSAAQQLEGVLSEMDDAVSNFAGAVEAANAPTEELVEKYGRLAEVAQRALEAMAAVDRVEAINAVNAAISEALGLITEVGRINARDQGQLFLVDSFGLAADEAQRLTEAIRALDSAQGLEAQAIAADRVQQELMQAYGSVEAMPGPMRAVYDALAQAASSAAEVNDATDDLPGLFSAAASAADSVASAVGGIAGAAQGAADAVAGLAARLWEAAQARAEAALDVQNDTGGLAAQYAQYGRGRAAGERLARESGSLYGGGSVLPGARGGGGGGAADQYAADLEALVTSLETERETLDAWYAENQAILADRRAEEILGTQAHKDALLALEQEYQSRLSEIEGTSQQQRLSDSASFFGSLASIAAAGGQKTAKAVAAFQAIEGTINAYGAAIKALNTPGISLAGRFAAYASVLAAGLKGVAAIRSAGGIGGGGGGAGTAIAAQGQQQQQQQVQTFMVKGIERDALYTGDMLAKIFDGITEEAQKRGLQVGLRFI